MHDSSHDLRRWITLVEAKEDKVMYHGTARKNLAFHPTAVAYFTPDIHDANEHARMDADIDGGIPHVLRVRLSIQNPARLDTIKMQDLHAKPEIVAELQARGYDSAIGDYDNEVAVFGNHHIHVEAIQDVDGDEWLTI